MLPHEHVSAAPLWPERGIVLSPVKLWVLAMLARKQGLCVAAVPPHAANLTGPARDADAVGRSGRRNRAP
jgi:hypothetical protein